MPRSPADITDECRASSPHADTSSLDAFKNFFLEKKLTEGTNVLLMYRTGRLRWGSTCA